MEFVFFYHELTGGIVQAFGGSDKLVHVHAGLLIYCAAQLAMRTRRGSWRALQCVITLELLNEAMDRVYWGSWRWDDTLGDFAATLFWPTMIYAIGRYRRARWRVDSVALRVPQKHPGRSHSFARNSAQVAARAIR